jgi:hypothetical protein
MLILTRSESAKTPIPAKNETPRYLNRNEKQRIKVNGKVAIAGI